MLRAELRKIWSRPVVRIAFVLVCLAQIVYVSMNHNSGTKELASAYNAIGGQMDESWRASIYARYDELWDAPPQSAEDLWDASLEQRAILMAYDYTFFTEMLDGYVAALEEVYGDAAVDAYADLSTASENGELVFGTSPAGKAENRNLPALEKSQCGHDSLLIQPTKHMIRSRPYRRDYADEQRGRNCKNDDESNGCCQYHICKNSFAPPLSLDCLISFQQCIHKPSPQYLQSPYSWPSHSCRRLCISSSCTVRRRKIIVCFKPLCLLSPTDNGEISVGGDLIHQSVEDTNCRKADQIHNDGQERIIHTEQHKDLQNEGQRKRNMATGKDQRHIKNG